MRFITLLLFIAITVLACENSDTTAKKEEGGNQVTKENSDVDKNLPEPIQKSGSGLLEFNNGNKWLANPETSEGMLMMQILIKGFFETDEGNRNYAELTGELQYQCNYIIKNCSMKGESHEQLHSVLHPILEEIKLAHNAPSYEEADASIQKVNELVKEYFLYFEVKEAV